MSIRSQRRPPCYISSILILSQGYLICLPLIRGCQDENKGISGVSSGIQNWKLLFIYGNSRICNTLKIRNNDNLATTLNYGVIRTWYFWYSDRLSPQVYIDTLQPTHRPSIYYHVVVFVVTQHISSKWRIGSFCWMWKSMGSWDIQQQDNKFRDTWQGSHQNPLVTRFCQLPTC